MRLIVYFTRPALVTWHNGLEHDFQDKDNFGYHTEPAMRAESHRDSTGDNSRKLIRSTDSCTLAVSIQNRRLYFIILNHERKPGTHFSIGNPFTSLFFTSISNKHQYTTYDVFLGVSIHDALSNTCCVNRIEVPQSRGDSYNGHPYEPTGFLSWHIHTLQRKLSLDLSITERKRFK